MAVPVITKVQNDGRGNFAFGKNRVRWSAPATASNQWADDVLIDLSAAFASGIPDRNFGVRYPLGIKITKIVTDITAAAAASVTYEFDHNTDIHVVKHTVIAGGEEKVTADGWRAKDTTSELLFGCEATFDAQASITAAQESSIIKEGTYAAKLTTAAAFTTGLMASDDFSAFVASSYHRLGAWVRSSVALQPDDLYLCLDESGSCASVVTGYALNVHEPLGIDIYSWVTTDMFPSATGDRDALLSVGIGANRDFGAADIYLDGIRLLKDPCGTPGAFGDIILTSTGLANGDYVTGYMEFEYIWSPDGIRS